MGHHSLQFYSKHDEDDKRVEIFGNNVIYYRTIDNACAANISNDCTANISNGSKTDINATVEEKSPSNYAPTQWKMKTTKRQMDELNKETQIYSQYSLSEKNATFQISQI